MFSNKKLILEEENLKFEESVGERVKLKKQRVNLPAIAEQKGFNNFLEQIKEEQKNVDMRLFRDVFNYETPDEMLEYLDSFKEIDNYNQATSPIEENFADFQDMVEVMSEDNEKNKITKILNIVDQIFNFISNEQKQRGQGLKILTPNQMFSRLPITLVQLKAGNDFEKL